MSEKNNFENEEEQAAAYFVISRQSFSGTGGWSTGRTGRTRRKTQEWVNTIDRLDEIQSRIRQVLIENLSYETIIKKYDGKDSLFYLDPPYILKNRGYYKISFTEDDHKHLVEILLNIQGMAVLSGYDNEIYVPLERRGWEKFFIKQKCHSSKNIGVSRSDRMEVIWRKPVAKKGLIF